METNIKQHQESSILEQFPAYNFKPTSLHNTRGNEKWLCYPLILIECLLSCIFCASFFNEPSFLSVVGILLSILLFFTIRWLIRRPKKVQIADYIQSTKGITIFVKDRKFGLLNNFNHKILIPAMYDQLSWVQINKTLRANFGNETFMVDKYNHRLT